MTARPLVLVAGALALLSGVAWVSQHRSADTDPVVVSGGAPISAAPVAAPVAPPAPALREVARVDPAWVSRTAAAAGISEPAVAAYGAAVLGQPTCAIGWTTLAGLGWVESHHGTLGGRTLSADGRPSSPIVGIALDGDGVAAIPATRQSSRLHGDRRWDHAVGPLQFIPSTWRTWGRDGDGDGRRDPQDVDDAAAAAAAYLCGTGDDLTTGAGWSQAILAYNHSAAYVADVYAAATTYAERTE